MSSTLSNEKDSPNGIAKNNAPDYRAEIWRTFGASITAGIALMLTATPLAAWYVSTSVDHATTKALDPVKRTQDRQSVVMRYLIEKGAGASDAEKKIFDALLNQVSFQDTEERIESLPKQREDRDLKALEAEGKLILTSEVRTGLTWDHGNPAQIRYFQSTDPTLDFRKIDFFTKPGENEDQGCRSRNLDLSVSPDLVVKVCVGDHFHVNKRLEFIVVRQPDASTTGSPPLSD